VISPHGGRLVNRVVEPENAQKLAKEAAKLPKLTLNQRELCDLEMISTGAMSPLEGFMGSADYYRVVEKMHLAKGLPWSIPVTLSAKSLDNGQQAKEGDRVALCDEAGNALALMEITDAFQPDKGEEAEKVLRTRDNAHPGVAYLESISDTYLGGPVEVLQRFEHGEFSQYRLDPAESRVLFKEKGWERIVAFQTRNPIHRAHEYLQKCALEMVDGLFIHPLVGETKKGDTPVDVRMKCYLALLDNYYPKDRVVMAVFPAAMRYAGPREAIFHALVRKNYGCTHIIIGRDHAGVGSYYGTYDAQHIFSEFEPAELDITPIFFENSFFCQKCGNMASKKTCPHGSEHHLALSGTKVREMLAQRQMPPVEFTRPEVAQILMDSVDK
jgi:sulfate adenylyltransferase